ncbi:hypothetical protein, partial [Morganella morganii]|uniref:hypothetical protein n=1 Tax=Morganella morganii TaxID=582 RepID=UPI001FFC39C2
MLHYFPTPRSSEQEVVWKNGTDDSIFSMNSHAYFVRDVDNFRRASPLTEKTRSDHNRRQLDIYGVKFQPVIKLHGQNDL